MNERQKHNDCIDHYFSLNFVVAQDNGFESSRIEIQTESRANLRIHVSI